MADSIRKPVPSNTWVKVNGTETFGTIYHISGGPVVYVQSATIPTVYDDAVAVIGKSKAGELMPPYTGLGTTGLYAYALSGDAVLGIAPGE